LDGTNQFIYVDGELKRTGNKGISDFTWQTNVLIGFSADANIKYFTGSIDDIRFYNRALSEIEIQALHTIESESFVVPSPTSLPTSKSNLIIQDITWLPTNPNTEQTVTFTVTVKNQGMGNAANSYVRHYTDGTSQDTTKGYIKSWKITGQKGLGRLSRKIICSIICQTTTF
jgi:hypothetical protein